MICDSFAHGVLSCAAAKALEAEVLTDDDAAWSAMRRAGRGLAAAVMEDYRELRDPPQRLRILALIGKGHNGGDALIACGQLLADFPRAQVDLVLVAAEADLKPLTQRALGQLEGRVAIHRFDDGPVEAADGLLRSIAGAGGFHLCLDGLLGMDFKPPLRAPLDALIRAVNDLPGIDLRAAVDLPSGAGDADGELMFQADFSYATGIAKKPLFEGIADCGRIRYIDLGFFDRASAPPETVEFVLPPSVLEPLARLRPAYVDKRAFGHLFILGGSAYMPGALLMTVQAAVRSGVGLVTAFAPASVAASLSAQVPEAMWVPWPETSNGTLDPRALPLLTDRIPQASSLLVGPGMGRDRNTERLAQEIVAQVECPILFDADGLRARVVEVAQRRKRQFGPVVIAPHMGEFMRVAKLTEPTYSTGTLIEFSRTNRVMTVLKGTNTRICDGRKVWYSTRGGPVLSRGGSGDLLAGLIGGQMAQSDKGDGVIRAVARGVTLHGLAAERLARSKGQVMLHTTQLLDYLPEVLRSLDRRRA
ncbi:MAG: NAD(P)H-hydrate dehydratase [Opitutales bacterium]